VGFFGIVDARVEAGLEHLDEGLADDVEVAEGEVTLVELAVVELVEDGVADDLLDVVLADGAA
jgi:hypothetical protein